MLIQNIALVPEAGGVTPAELLRVSAALQKQVGSHFGPCWGIHASVDPFLELEQVPAGYLPIVLSAPESATRALEVSLDSNGQPYARVSLNAGWSLAASRACLELLLNPFGQRTVNASSPRSDQGPVEILVEACGAFGETPAAYAVNDVAVSDFCTPAFFRAQGGESYSFRGALSAPLSLLRGGHLAWFDAISNNWWLRSFHDENPIDRALGPLTARGRSLRAQILRQEPHGGGSALSHEPLDARIRWQWLREQASAASVARAQRLRASLGLPVGTRQYDEEDDEETVAMALSAPRIEPSRGRRSSPPPLPESRGNQIERHDAGPAAVSVEREQGNPREQGNVIVHELRAAAVIVEARDAASNQAVERRDTLPLTQLLPPPAQASEPVAREPYSEPAPAPSPQLHTPPPALEPAPGRSKSAARPVTAGVSHSSIAPIAMLAEPARGEGSRTGLMLAGAGAAALLAIAIMSGGTRSAAHTSQAASPKPAPAAVAETKSVEAAAPAPAPLQPVVVAPPATSASEPLPAPVAKAERPRSSEHAASAEASRAREEAREKRRQREPQEIAPAPASADESVSQGQRTAAIENLFDTRR